MSKSRFAAGLLLCLSFSFGALQSPAAADTVTKTDRKGDAPEKTDITRVMYLNAPQKIVTHVVVPELVRGGSAALYFAAPNTDVGYMAIVRVRSDGSLKKRYVLVDNEGAHKRACSFKAVWNAGENYIDISVPRKCAPAVGGGSLYMGAMTGGGKDYAPPARHLARG